MVDSYGTTLVSAFSERGYPDLPAYGPGHGPLRQPNTARRAPPQDKALARTLGSRGGAASRPARDGPPQAPSGAAQISMQDPASGVKGDARKDRRAPARQAVQFPLWCKGSKDVRGFPKLPQRFPFRCNKTATTSPAGRMSLLSPSLRRRQLLCR